ncbi:MAG: aminotransferase class I/II-fold pyridoxal phosphate-dependent enzyme [Polyangiales bacterium]
MEFLIPSRTSRPADDPIFALNAEANARRQKGESVVNATVGALLEDDGKLAVLPTVIEALREVAPVQAASYAPLAGPKAFLDATIADLLGGSPFAEHAVAVATPGGTGALRHAMATFLEPGQAMLTSSFYWGPYKTIADENDRKVATFPMFERKGQSIALDVAGFDSALKKQAQEQKRVLLFLNDPCHNPTGYSMRAEEWRAVVSSIEEVAGVRGGGVPVTFLVDVAYWMYGPGDPRAFLKNLEPLLGKVALAFAWSASKSFTQYGARVGALMVVDPEAARRKRTLDALSFACRGVWSNCNHLGLLAITRLLTDPTLRAKVDAERDGFKKLLDGRVHAFNEAAKSTSLEYPRYDGGFFSTVFAPKGVDVQRAAAAMRERGVFVVPQGDGLRVALCSVAERDVPRLVHELDAALSPSR